MPLQLGRSNLLSLAVLIRKIAAHSVVQNTAWLSVLQIFSYISPLIVLPYLTGVLSVDEFGIVMIAITTVAISSIATDYGFSFSATSRISQNRHDAEYINKLIARIFTAKLFLVILGFATIIGISQLPAYVQYHEVFLIGSIAMVAQAFYSTWLFQGLEQLRFYTIYMASVKLLYVGLVVLFISDTSDPSNVLWCWSIASTIGMIISLKYLKMLGYKIGFASISEAFNELRYSTQFFLSRLAVTLYTSVNSIILGLTSLHHAAIYTSAEQCYKAGQAFTGSVSSALYPYMAKEKNWQQFTAMTIMSFLTLTILAVIAALNSEMIISLIFGSEYIESASVLSAMMVVLVINFLGSVYGYPALSAVGKINFANASVIIGAAVSLSGVWALSLFDALTPITVAINLLVAESIVLTLRLILVLPIQFRSLANFWQKY